MEAGQIVNVNRHRLSQQCMDILRRMRRVKTKTSAIGRIIQFATSLEIYKWLDLRTNLMSKRHHDRSAGALPLDLDAGQEQELLELSGCTPQTSESSRTSTGS